MTVETMFEKVTDARRVLADVTAHEDSQIINACQVIEAYCTDQTETAEASDLRQFIEDNPT